LIVFFFFGFLISCFARSEGGPPKPENDEEARLNEYYKNYYAQMYAQATEDYQRKLKEYEEAQAAQNNESTKKRPAPDDGYEVPKPEFEEYRVKGTFAKVQGRFMAEGTGGSEYWASKVRPLEGDKLRKVTLITCRERNGIEKDGSWITIMM
jgi:hypothetical protein